MKQRFSNVTVNGRVINCSGGSITIKNGDIFVDGKCVESNIGNVVEVVVNGDVGSLDCTGSVQVNGNVENIKCGGSCRVDGDVSGNVNSGGSTRCGNVGGNVNAGGSVHCS